MIVLGYADEAALPVNPSSRPHLAPFATCYLPTICVLI